MIKAEELQSLQSGHRARLRKKFLDDELKDYEILELLLTYAIPRRDVRALSRQLFNKYGSIPKLLASPIESLMENDGVKENTATFFKVIHKLTQMEYESKLKAVPIFHDYNRLINYCKVLLDGKTVEEFHILYLDGQYRLIKDELHSSGTITWAAVYIREIAKKALDLNAQSIIMIHNHPGSDNTFSQDDIKTTLELEDALSKLGITLYDHLLVSSGVFYSARNMHLLNNISNH